MTTTKGGGFKVYNKFLWKYQIHFHEPTKPDYCLLAP